LYAPPGTRKGEFNAQTDQRPRRRSHRRHSRSCRNETSTFVVERSVTINATPEKIAPIINDFHNWNVWSPWAKLDPTMKTTYSGAPSGVGSIYEWEGNSKVGKGRMEITSIQPAKTTIKLDFLKPFEGHNTTDFVLEPEGSTATRVIWVMYGP